MANGPDELHLLGILQIETARDALIETGMNNSGVKMFTAFVNVFNAIGMSDDNESHLASFYISGGDTSLIKQSVIESLGIVVRTTESALRQTAASALLEILIEK